MLYFLIASVLACDYQSTYANITDTNALIPIHHIKHALTQPITIPDTADLSNITLYTYVKSYNFTDQGQVTLTLKSAISYIYNFNSFQSLGQAIMDNGMYVLQLSFNEGTFEQVSSAYTSPTQFNFIGLQQYTNQYPQAANSINSQIPQQLTQIYNAVTLAFTPITLDFNYVYTNINGVKQPISFQYQSDQLDYNNNILSLNGQLIIQDYDNNICQQTQLPTATNEFKQLQLYSTSVLETIIQYSYQQEYFNAYLNEKWKSADFQFFVGAFAHILNGLDELNPMTPVAGWCNLTALPTFTITNITMLYQCNMKLDTIDLLQVNLKLTLDIEFKQIEESIIVLPNSYAFSTLFHYYDFPEKLSQRPLAELYIKTILNTHLLLKPLFGSEFKTIKRTNPNITVTNDYFMIYDN